MRSTRKSPQNPWWLRLSSEELMDVPISDLGLRIEGTTLESRIDRLYGELARAGFRFRPYVWLSTDYFTPDGLTGFAVPFFLAHPRLARLERRQMFEVEGGDRSWCMKLLRHETAHALDNAYRIHRKKRWREVFGYFSEPYRWTYVPRPTSKRYVLNLDYWYSQSHPAEDYAETFAVWLQPRSKWRERYAGWPALEKLEYVDSLMSEIRDKKPLLRTRARPESISRVKMTIGEYYRRKRRTYMDTPTRRYDEVLERLFSNERIYRRHESAARFLQRFRDELRQRISGVTGQHPYLVDQVLNQLILRCREANLRLTSSVRETRIDAAVLLTTLTMGFLYGGHPEYRR